MSIDQASHGSTASTHPSKWDTAYEWKVVALVAAGLALVNLDRHIITPLFPVLQKDLNLDYQDIGYAAGAIAMAWGVSSLFLGGLADRLGRKRVMVWVCLAFSMCAGLTGFAVGASSLILIRLLLGMSEGAFAPAGIATVMESSKPSRLGLNVGIVNVCSATAALAAGPIIATQLLNVLPSWRWIFVIAAFPGFVVAYLMYRVLRNAQPSAAATAVQSEAPQSLVKSWTAALKSRNVRLNLVGLSCAMTCLFVIAAMLPSYLTDYVRVDLQTMGFIMSALGIGGATGQLVLLALSDRLGRKPVLLFSYVGAAAALWLFMQVGAQPAMLFALLFIASFFVLAMIPMIAGTITLEAVPIAIASTATGLVIGVGELFGGGAAPAIAGYIAKNHGIQHTLTLSLGALGVGFLFALMLRESAPARLNRAVSLPAASARLRG
jgi:MFS family permease